MEDELVSLSPAIIFDDTVLFGPYVHRQPLQRLWCPTNLRGNRTIEDQVEVMRLYRDLVGDWHTFRFDALNIYNYWFYHRKYSPEVESLHNTFTQNKQIVSALGNCAVERLVGETCHVKVLMAGSSAEEAVRHIALEHEDTKFNVVLSDFFEIKVSGCVNSANLRVQIQEENVLDGLEMNAEELRNDVILGTYGFDSVWMNGDIHYILQDGKWYQSLHRLHEAEKGAGDYASPFIVETIVREVRDICGEAYGDVISELYGVCDEARVNVPAGLILTVIEAFEKQLKSSGMFVVGDICSDGDVVREYEFLESGAMYKIEDYRIAEKVFINLGFDVRLYSIEEFLKHYLPGAQPEKLLGKCVLVVRK